MLAEARKLKELERIAVPGGTKTERRDKFLAVAVRRKRG